MILNTTTRKLQAVLTAAMTTANMSVMVDYTDFSPVSSTEVTRVTNDNIQISSTNGTTAVDICAAPSAGIKRKINSIEINNSDTAAKTIRLNFVDGGTTYRWIAATLQVGDTFGYTEERGAYVMDSSGNQKTNMTTATNLTLLDAVEVNVGSSGAAGTLDIFPATAAKGKVQFTKANNTNDDTTTMSFDAMGQATTIHMGDLGAAADYVVRGTAQITLAEADVLDGATQGGNVASKVKVNDSNGNQGIAKVTELHIGATGAETQVTASAAELNYNDIATLGTAEANKTVTTDASKNVTGINGLTLGVNGAAGVAGTVTLRDGTNPGYAVTVKTDSQTADLTAHYPDPGAIVDAYVVMSTAPITAAEADVLDGAVAANSVASKAALLDASKLLQTNGNNGTPEAGVTAVHYGDGVNVTAVLTLTNVVLTVGTSQNLGVGSLLYTLPAGACLIRDAFMSVAIAGVTTTTDTPNVGLGTVVASGAVVLLNGTATFENIIVGQTAANTNGTATVKGAGPTAGAPLEITTGGAHAVYFNAAHGWGANADQAGTLNGTVVISYVRQAA